MSRPEDLLPPDLFYNDIESTKYTTSSRIQSIQRSMTERALSLLSLDSPSLVLDIGCGSGLSGEILSEAEHTWIGLDISPSMLAIALERSSEMDAPGDLFLSDMGQGLPFRPGTFDAAISISAIQWLCNAETSELNQSPEQRLRRFFDGLYACLKRGGKAALQFYPKNEAQRQMINGAAVKAGFGAGILEDDGGTKNVKTYLVLSVGGGDITRAVDGMDGVEVEDGRKIRQAMNGKHGRNASDVKGSKQWIMQKKEKMKGKGKVVKSDSKYTGRSRRVKF